MNSCVKYTVYKNLHKYVSVIGYETKDDIKPKEDFNKTMQFHSHIIIRATKTEEKLYIFLLDEDGFSGKSAEFNKLINIIPEKQADIIMVTHKHVGTSVKKFLDNYSKKKITVKNLLYDHFKSDLRNNVMVPKHTLCTQEEVDRVMQECHMESLSSFPSIRKDDPQVLWVNGTVGQVIKCERHMNTGVELYYRVII